MAAINATEAGAAALGPRADGGRLILDRQPIGRSVIRVFRPHSRSGADDSRP